MTDEIDDYADARALHERRRQLILALRGADEGSQPTHGHDGRLLPGKHLTCTCHRCGATGSVLDEFTSPYTGLCGRCAELERRARQTAEASTPPIEFSQSFQCDSDFAGPSQRLQITGAESAKTGPVSTQKMSKSLPALTDT